MSQPLSKVKALSLKGVILFWDPIRLLYDLSFNRIDPIKVDISITMSTAALIVILYNKTYLALLLRFADSCERYIAWLIAVQLENTEGHPIIVSHLALYSTTK